MSWLTEMQMGMAARDPRAQALVPGVVESGPSKLTFEMRLRRAEDLHETLEMQQLVATRMVGQSMPMNLEGKHAGDGKVIAARIEDGWLVVRVEVLDPSELMVKVVTFQPDDGVFIAPRQEGGPWTKPPNAWWHEFDRALAYATAQGWSGRKAEDYATDAAEREHPGGREASG